MLNTSANRSQQQSGPPADRQPDSAQPPNTGHKPQPRTVTESLEADSHGDYSAFPNPLRQPLRCAAWMVRTLFGIATLILLLAVVAAIPVLSLFVLGYLLEVEGCVARTGRLRSAFPLLHRAPGIGAVFVGIGLWLLPLFFLTGMAADAQLVDPSGSAAANWQTAKLVTAVIVAGHLCLALARGGNLGSFFRPLRNLRWFVAELQRDQQPTFWHRADERLRAFFRDLRLKHHFLLGCRGFAGAFAVLLLPTLLFAAATSTEPLPVLATIAGGVCLAVVFLYVPFLQARLAAQNRLSAMWDVREIRRLFRHAPLAWAAALLVVFALALPLYLFTALAAPRDVQWLITLVFVISIWPARVVTGWAYARAARQREARKPVAWFGFRWGARMAMLAVTLSYTLLFFFARDISSRGRFVLFEHHAFLGTVLSSLGSWAG